MNNKISEEIKILCSESNVLLNEFQRTDVSPITLSSRYNKWYSQALPVVRQLTPERLNDFEKCFSKASPNEPTISTYFACACLDQVVRLHHQKIAIGYFTFVAINKVGEATIVPKLMPITKLEKQLFNSALNRKFK